MESRRPTASGRSSGRAQPAINRMSGPSGQFADRARISFGECQRHVAGDRDDPQHLQFVGDASASRIATASSMPGSVSMMIFAGSAPRRSFLRHPGLAQAG